MVDKRRKYHGLLLVEVIVAISVLGILVIAFALSLNGFARFNRFQLVRQQCTAAAQAQLDSLAKTGKPVPDDVFKRLWPKLNVSIKQTEGAGQWQGLKLVEAEASGMSFNRPVKVQLARYVAAEIQLAEQEL